MFLVILGYYEVLNTELEVSSQSFKRTVPILFLLVALLNIEISDVL